MPMKTLEPTAPLGNRVPRGTETVRRDPATPPVTTRHVPDGSGALHGRKLASSVAQLLGSHAAAAAAGVVSLPVMARNLGPANYGAFSLFVLLLGVVTYQDFLRPLLIREWSRTREADEDDELVSMASFTAGAVALLATVVGCVLLPPIAAVAFAAAAAVHALGSVDHARLAASGRVGLAGAVRNVGMACALVLAMAVSFLPEAHGDGAVHVYAWPFVLTNAAVFAVNRRLVRQPLRLRWNSAAWRRARAAWRHHRTTIGSLVGFSVATAVVVSTDRVVLEHVVDPETFGAYAACADLAVKLTVVGTALGMALYPALSQAHARDPARAARRFVRIASLVMLGWFVTTLALVAWHRQIVTLVLGERFVPGHALYAWILCGTFVHMLGFLFTPWQRARGDFGTHTRAYALAGVAMVTVGVVAIPALGAVGAVACYLTARSAEVMILCAELRRLPGDVLPRWKLAALALMVVAVGATAWFTSGGAA